MIESGTMNTMFLSLGIVIVVYAVAMLIWSERLSRRYDKEIYEPWGRAIRNHDFKESLRYSAASKRFLSDYNTSLFTMHPRHWIRTWNKDWLVDD